MPAKSKAQQALMAIAEHAPEKLKGKNKGIAKSMSKQQLHDFAATPLAGLPEHVPEHVDQKKFTAQKGHAFKVDYDHKA